MLIGIAAMLCHAVQFAMQPLLTRWYAPPNLPKAEMVLACELLKGVLALAMLVSSGKLRTATRGWTLGESVRIAAAPAALYAVQNVLIQIGYANLDGITFNVLNQSKICWAAAFVYLFVGRLKQSREQCIALAMVITATLIMSQQHVNVGGGDGGSGGSEAVEGTGEAAPSAVLWLGLAPALGAAAISGFTAALSQRVLQKNGRETLLYSLELSVYSAITLIIGMLAQSNQLSFGSAFQTADHNAVDDARFAFAISSRWTRHALIPLATNAGGGIIVGFVVKFAGGVQKGLATALGIAFTGVFAYLLEGTPPVLFFHDVILLNTSLF